jgi:hypothetical protein
MNVNEALDLSNALSAAGQEDYDLVLYQVNGNFLPQRNATGNFCLEKVFKNQAHMLLLFSRPPNCIEASN